MQSELNEEWDPLTTHLKICQIQKGSCIGKNINGSPCKSLHGTSAQSCNLGTGSYCAIHYKKNISKNHDPQLSTCANVRCDDLDILKEDRQKINQHNIKKILGLSGNVMYRHISATRYKLFDYGAFEDLKILAILRNDKERDDNDEEFDKPDSASETDVESDDIDYAEERGQKRTREERLLILPTKRYRLEPRVKFSRIL
uniref:Uncharacterized protein n=1 Tax=viral metagenome TaxID=1070528 RepID=A0A6C0C7G3_9ZZZZ